MLLTPVLALLQTLSRLHCCADRAARHRRRMSSQVWDWMKQARAEHSTIWITYSSYSYGPWRVVSNAYFSSDLVQFDRGGTTQNLGRIVCKPARSIALHRVRCVGTVSLFYATYATQGLALRPVNLVLQSSFSDRWFFKTGDFNFFRNFHRSVILLQKVKITDGWF